jgi:outer membrane protein TolC
VRRTLLPQILAAGVAALAPSVGLAQPPRTPAADRVFHENLSLHRAVEIALKQNPEILKALQEIERTRGQFIEIRAEALPHVSLSGNYRQQDPALVQGFGAPVDTAAQKGNEQLQNTLTGLQGNLSDSGQVTAASELGQVLNSLQSNPQPTSSQGNLFQSLGSGGMLDKSWRIAIEVRQALYTGGQVRAALRIAKFTQESSYWNLRDTVDRIVARVRTQFDSILLNRSLITVQEESTRLLENQLQDQQNRFKAGSVPRFNVLRAEVELSNVRPNLIRARNDYLIAQLELCKTLGLPAGPGGDPQLLVVGQLSGSPRPFSLSTALQVARERRPLLKVQRQNILIETEQIKVALAGYKPRLDINAGYEARNSILSNDLSDVINGWFFGVTGRWEIFDGLATSGRTQQARSRLETARLNYLDSLQQVELEVQKAFARMRQAQETIESQQKNVEQALEALRLATERLDAGAGTQLDVLDARVALTRARITELQARADYQIALAEFDRVTATDTVYEESFRDPLSKNGQPSGTQRKGDSKPGSIAPKKK